MNKLLIGTALVFTALPFTFDDVTPAVSKAHAIIGRPLTPMSVAGVHRRAMRRTYGVGANVGYHPVARAAAVGAVAAGAGYYGARYGGGYGYGAPSYAGVGSLYNYATPAADLATPGYGFAAPTYNYAAPAYTAPAGTTVIIVTPGAPAYTAPYAAPSTVAQPLYAYAPGYGYGYTPGYWNRGYWGYGYGWR